MKLGKDDFSPLAWPIAIFLGAIVFALAVPIAAEQFLHNKVMDASGAEKALAEANDRIREAKRDRENQSSYQASYGRLVDRGVIGDFQRLDLVEQLKKIDFDMQYSISPQQKIPASEFFALEVNRAIFRLNLLHEGKLLDFLDALEAQTKGIPLVEGCGIERIGMAGGNEPHLKAVCTVSWVTLESLK